jgi:hypothetical protein
VSTVCILCVCGSLLQKTAMARPRGGRKAARLTVSLDEGAYTRLAAIAKRKDVSIAWLARRAIYDALEREQASDEPELPLFRRTPPQSSSN